MGKPQSFADPPPPPQAGTHFLGFWVNPNPTLMLKDVLHDQTAVSQADSALDFRCGEEPRARGHAAALGRARRQGARGERAKGLTGSWGCIHILPCAEIFHSSILPGDLSKQKDSCLLLGNGSLDWKTFRLKS